MLQEGKMKVVLHAQRRIDSRAQSFMTGKLLVQGKRKIHTRIASAFNYLSRAPAALCTERS
jgi:hypothetical protein